MSEELNKLAQALVESTAEYRDLLEQIKKQDPELFAKFEEKREQCEGLESAVKSLLKDENNNLEIEDHKFRVSTSTRSGLDLESVILDAEEHGHLPLLVEYGVLEFKGNASKVERLPDETKALYQNHVTKSTVKRVTMPKSLKRPW